MMLKIIIKLERNYYPVLMMYGEKAESFGTSNQNDSTSSSITLFDGEAEVQTGRIIGSYKDLFFICKKLQAICSNLLNQISSSLNKNDKSLKTTFKYNLPSSACETLSKALLIILTIDSLVKDNENLRNHWNLYKRMLKIIRSEPEKYNVEENQLRMFENLLIKIDKTFMSGELLKVFLTTFEESKKDSSLNSLTNFPSPHKNKEMMEFIDNYLRLKLKDLEDTLATENDILERVTYSKSLCLYALFRRLYKGEEDKKLWKGLWNLQTIQS